MKERGIKPHLLEKKKKNSREFVDLFYFFKKIFLERGREGEREGEKQQCVVACCTPPVGDLAHNPDMCPDWELNWQPFGSQTPAKVWTYFKTSALPKTRLIFPQPGPIQLVSIRATGSHKAHKEPGTPPLLC